MKQNSMSESMTDRLSFETEGQETFVVCRLSSEEEADTGLIELLKRQKLVGIASLVACQTGVDPVLRFCLRGNIPLSTLVSGGLNRKQLQRIISGLATAYSSLEAYLLDPLGLVLDKRYLFLTEGEGNSSEADLEAVYLPLVWGMGQKSQRQVKEAAAVEQLGHTVDPLGDFLRRLLPELRLIDQEGLLLWAELLQFVQSRAVIAPAELLALLKAGQSSAEVKDLTVSGIFESSERQQRRETLRHQCRSFYQDEADDVPPTIRESEAAEKFINNSGSGLKAIWSKLKNFWQGRKRTKACEKHSPVSAWMQTGAATGAETMLLHDSRFIGGSAARLVRDRTHECFLLDKPRQRIGKGSRGVDILIESNASISRCHAEVRLGPDGYSLTDLASTNHSYVNGRQLLPHKPEPIRPGDVIRLADEDFYFRE